MNRAIDKLTSDYERSSRERFTLLHAFAEQTRRERELARLITKEGASQ